MSKLSGIFESFPNLDQLPLEKILSNLKAPPNEISLENFLANRILYPQAVPVSKEDLDLDLAIVREALKDLPEKKFYDKQNKKIFIPENFLTRFPDIKKLALCFVEGFKPQDIAQFLIVRSNGKEPLGSFIPLKFENKKGKVDLDVEGVKFTLNAGKLVQVPCPPAHCHIQFKASGVRLFNKSEGVFEAVGGSLGLLIDGREK